AMAPRTLLL
nr:Chain P, Qdm peptide [Mus musculus]5VCL_P Chain P, Qdm peptide [Mus musculus]8UMO_P Chain P, Qdm peptide [Mus musculus]